MYLFSYFSHSDKENIIRNVCMEKVSEMLRLFIIDEIRQYIVWVIEISDREVENILVNSGL